jgi:hypothetical protein
MALKRLDEEFELKPGTQLLPYMKRLLPSLEGRFQDLEETATIYAKVIEDIRAAALLRMNEILIPATEDIIKVTQLGFLLAPVSTPYTLALGYMAIFVDDGPQRETFTPSPYLIIEHTPSDYGIARTMSYNQDTGLLEMTVTAIHGNAGPWSDWMVSSTPGMADSTKMYHDAVAPMHDEVKSDYDEIVAMHAEILSVADDLEGAGIDLFNYVRKDGTTPFSAVQTGVAPQASANDTSLVTAAWSRSRINEYLANAVQRAGDTMTGMLTLAALPSAAMHATPRSYVDSAVSTAASAKLNVSGGQTITGGFTFTPYVQVSGSFTPNANNGNYQAISNVGAFTISAPTTDCALDLMVINGAGAGAISFSGFTVGPNTGDLLTSVNGHRFIISMRRIVNISTYVIKALQ